MHITIRSWSTSSVAFARPSPAPLARDLGAQYIISFYMILHSSISYYIIILNHITLHYITLYYNIV